MQEIDEKRDRRAGFRYPVSAPLMYRLAFGTDGAKSGSGNCINMSGNSILFEAEHPVEVGAQIELAIDWPSPRSVAPILRLWVHGSAVRTEGNQTAVIADRQEFRADPGWAGSALPIS
jgi:hypothetical protein